MNDYLVKTHHIFKYKTVYCEAQNKNSLIKNSKYGK